MSETAGDHDLQRGLAPIQVSELCSGMVGQVLTGTDIKLAPPGAFVRVADGVAGLVPAQELAVPLETLRSGDVVSVAVAGIDRERRRLTLSQRATSAGLR